MTTLNKYVLELVQDPAIESVLISIVKGFAKVWLGGADKMDKQKAWNFANVLLKTLDNSVRMKIRSDRNTDGFAVDLGG